jgi:UPF0716 protein FxsA
VSRRRKLLPWVLVVAFVVVPLVEIYVLIQVGQVIGVWWTIVLLILDSMLGGWLVKREGAKTFDALRTAINSGRMPGRELADAALVLTAGILMLTPGFVLDVVGLLLVLPVTRPLARRGLTVVVTRRLLAGGGPAAAFRAAAAAQDPTRDPTKDPRNAPPHPGPGPEGPVVRGEVVDD